MGRIGALLGYVFQTPHGLVPRRVPVLKYSSMSTDPNDPLTVIEQAFARIAECPGFCGAVLATSDGLVLACTGTLQGDVAAACAASLSLDVRSALETMRQREAQEIMLWSDDRVWYEICLSTSHLLLAVSLEHKHSGALRLAIRSELDVLQVALLHL